MTLKDVMSVEVAMVRLSLKVGSLLVYDGRRLNGMITDRDIAIRGTAAGQDPKNHSRK